MAPGNSKIKSQSKKLINAKLSEGLKDHLNNVKERNSIEQYNLTSWRFYSDKLVSPNSDQTLSKCFIMRIAAYISCTLTSDSDS